MEKDLAANNAEYETSGISEEEINKIKEQAEIEYNNMQTKSQHGGWIATVLLVGMLILFALIIKTMTAGNEISNGEGFDKEVTLELSIDENGIVE